MADHSIVGRSLSPAEQARILDLAANGRTVNLRNLLGELAQTHGRTVGQLILEARDQVGLSIVHKAAENNRIEVIRMVCDNLGFTTTMRHAVLNMQEQGGRTAASIAAQLNHDHFLRELIVRGANMLIKDWFGGVPLHRAAMSMNTTAMCWLVEMTPQKGGINIQNLSGQTPLHVSLAVGDILRAGYLIKSGADVNLRMAVGDAPLHQSIPLWTEANDDPGFNSMMLAHFERLFSAGADPLLPNGFDKLPREIALEMGHDKATMVIMAHGG